MFQDQTLQCRDCGRDFVWTASEQEFYQSKGFTNKPTRCAECRKNKKARMNGGRERQSFEITCSQCGRTDTVPFKPTEGRPVLCSDCFKRQKDQGGQPQA